MVRTSSDPEDVTSSRSVRIRLDPNVLSLRTKLTMRPSDLDLPRTGSPLPLTPALVLKYPPAQLGVAALPSPDNITLTRPHCFILHFIVMDAMDVNWCLACSRHIDVVRHFPFAHLPSFT